MTDRSPVIYPSDADGVAAVARVLREGGLAAFPTETVYGLGADARNDQAVAAVFEAKGRPVFNPLIVHVPDMAAAEELVRMPDAAVTLATAFWPGPLTLVLPVRPDAGLSALVTAGLDTLAIRVPDHPIARDILRAAGCPVAAPSANPSGRISPTTAAHVVSGLGGRVAAILDGGPCAVGLESTIVSCVDTPRLLRAGGLPETDVARVLGQHLSEAGPGIVAPGQLSSHYAPRGRVRLNARDARAGEVLLGFGRVDGALNLSPSGNLVEAAANLFAMLHQLDQMDAKEIAVAPVPMVGLGVAINDRLRRAAAPRHTADSVG